MCVVSMVFDHYKPLIPDVPTDTIPITPWPTIPPFAPSPYPDTIAEAIRKAAADSHVAELRKLIDDFRAAVAAAKIVDAKTNQPDCEDPEKATVLERVARLEQRLDAIEAVAGKRP